MITGFCFVTQFPAVTVSRFKSNDSSFSLHTPSVRSRTGGLLILVRRVLHSHLRIQHQEQEGSTERNRGAILRQARIVREKHSLLQKMVQSKAAS